MWMMARVYLIVMQCQRRVDPGRRGTQRLDGARLCSIVPMILMATDS